MASSGNEIERWNHKQEGELLEPVTSPENGNRLSPVKSINSVDNLSHLHGKSDSAYSSFSGGSNVPECHLPSCYSESCCVPPEQAPYMDSEYVRGIYNLSATNSELRCMHPYKSPDLSSHNNSHSVSLAERYGNTPTRGTVNQRSLPLAAPPPPMPSPPSPPTRLDSYKVTRHFENTTGRCNSGSRSEHSVQPSPVQDNQLEDKDIPCSQIRDNIAEQDILAARRKTLENKDLSSSDAKNGLSKSKNQRLKTEEIKKQSLFQEPLKRSNPRIFIRPSSFIFQEYLKTDSMASAPKILSAYKIPEEMNSKAYPPPHTNPNTVNDIQENKQYPCIVHKPNFREVGLLSTVSEPSQRKGSLPHAHCPVHAELHSNLDRDVFEDSYDLKNMENTLPVKNASKKLNSCTDKYQCYDSKGETGNDVWEPLLNQQAKMQKSSVSHSLDSVESEYPCCRELDHVNKQCCDNTNQTFFRPKEDATSHFLNESNKEKQVNSSPDLAMHLEQEKSAPPVCFQKYQPGLQKQLERQLQDNIVSEQINRQTTPLLYYLSGGKTTNILHQRKHTQHQEDLRNLPKKFSTSDYSASVRSVDIQRESNQLQKTKHNHQCIADNLNEADDVILGSPGSSVDESFKNDYREQLKVAQKKVLRETSFKRKDLQISLPIRLRKKPSKRPSIEHLRSFSLSSPNEDAKPVSCPPPSPQLIENFSKGEEINGTQMGRIGGRKKATKEQKKLCFSEPEKLNQLEDRDVLWSQVRDEITEQDVMAAGRKTLENRGRALSSSGISKTELKQIQHTALIEYMERKISQRPSSSQHIPLHNPPMQKRPSYPKWPFGKISNLNKSRKIQNNEVLYRVFSEEEFPDVFPPLAAPLSLTSRCNASSSASTVSLKPNLSPKEADGSCTSRYASAENLPQAGASGKDCERSKSTPPPMQGTSRCAGSPAPPAQSSELCLGLPSFHDAEKDDCKSYEDKDNNIIGSSCCQFSKELIPETSIPIPRSGSKEDTQVEKECRIKSLNGNFLIKCPEQQLEADDPVVPQEKVIHCQTTFLFQAHQGEKNTANGLAAKETSVPTGQDDILPEKEKYLPKRRLQSAEDQRYEELAMEIIAKDSSLADILMPHTIRKTTLDLMEGLFPINISMLGKSHRKKEDVQPVQESEKGNQDLTEESPETEHNAKDRNEDPVSKGNQILNKSRDSTNDLDDITSKKMELISSLRSKLQTLREERELVLSETKKYAERGKELEAVVQDICKPNEFERYMMFIGDLEKVVSLFLCLSSRLARVQNAMRKIDGNTDAEEKQSLNERHKLLSRQREDAKDLKENLDRRERVVSSILAKYLTDQQLQDYRHFVQVKTSLLIEQKDLEEQIKFLEEQLENLEKSIHL
ncbi:protein Shroom1 isoform X2 [Rhea pennata]|uniref:protein Shroom1 isoform X2 n=1 Tax=Rhea pennata TaxID=8795 RepID=UPI002E275D64